MTGLRADEAWCAAPVEAGAHHEYEALLASALETQGTAQAAALAQEAIEVAPDRPDAYDILAAAYTSCGDWVRASECYVAAAQRWPAGGKSWATSTFQAWMCRELATCDSGDVFCCCTRCAALPKKPSWMSSSAALKDTSDRVVAAYAQRESSWQPDTAPAAC
jgi:hypothetical protein